MRQNNKWGGSLGEEGSVHDVALLELEGGHRDGEEGSLWLEARAGDVPGRTYEGRRPCRGR